MNYFALSCILYKKNLLESNIYSNFVKCNLQQQFIFNQIISSWRVMYIAIQDYNILGKYFQTWNKFHCEIRVLHMKLYIENMDFAVKIWIYVGYAMTTLL